MSNIQATLGLNQLRGSTKSSRYDMLMEEDIIQNDQKIRIFLSQYLKMSIQNTFIG